MRIRKWDNKVEVTVKLIQKLRDSTILVHKKVLGTDVWDEFEDVANKYFLSQPSYRSTNGAIHDGSTTVFEGYMSKRYHFLERYVMSLRIRTCWRLIDFYSGLQGTSLALTAKGTQEKLKGWSEWPAANILYTAWPGA